MFIFYSFFLAEDYLALCVRACCTAPFSFFFAKIGNLSAKNLGTCWSTFAEPNIVKIRPTLNQIYGCRISPNPDKISEFKRFVGI